MIGPMKGSLAFIDIYIIWSLNESYHVSIMQVTADNVNDKYYLTVFSFIEYNMLHVKSIMLEFLYFDKQIYVHIKDTCYTLSPKITVFYILLDIFLTRPSFNKFALGVRISSNFGFLNFKMKFGIMYSRYP